MFFKGESGPFSRQLEARVNEKFLEGQIIAKVILWANLRHQRSAGKFQIQGNGALVLTSDVLWFSLFYPNKQIEMPLQTIRAVQIGRIRKQGEQPAVFVNFTPASGIEDQVVIELRQPESWKRIIDETITKRIF